MFVSDYITLEMTHDRKVKEEGNKDNFLTYTSLATHAQFFKTLKLGGPDSLYLVRIGSIKERGTIKPKRHHAGTWCGFTDRMQENLSGEKQNLTAYF